jgi:hypothetical protein
MEKEMNMKYNIKNLEQVKYFVTKRANGHNVYTNPNIFIGQLSKESFRKSDTFCVWFNIELVYLLLSKYNINPNKIMFAGDDADKKKKWVETFGVRYIDYQEESIDNMKFTYTLMNPGFDITIECFETAKNITEEKIFMISNTSAFERKKMLENLAYYEALGVHAFDEQIMTALSVYNINGAEYTEVKFKDGTKEIVTDIQMVPGENNIKEWKFACSVIAKKLDGIEVNYGALERPKVKQATTGIPLIFNVGKASDDDFSDIVICDIEQKEKATGFGKHKVVFNKNGAPGKIGAIKYAGPEYGTGHNAMSIIVDSKEIALEYIEYLKSEPVARMVKGIKSNTVVNKQGVFQFIPKMELKDQWI